MFYISTTSDYAVLSALTYNDIRINIQNREVLPPSWVELTQFTVDGSGANASFFSGGGFSAKAFQNTSTGVVVISYAGTEATFSKGLFTDFAMANIPAAIGLAAPQAVAAANFYQLVASSASVAGAPITFTGHSLGGGLAAMMSVLFATLDIRLSLVRNG